MNTKLTLQEIGNLLDRSSNQLDRTTLDGLYSARQHSLRHRRASTPTWVSQDGTLHGHLHLSHRAYNWLIAAIVVTLLTINLSYWYHTSDRDHSDIDIAILTDDLPVDMYVD